MIKILSFLLLVANFSFAAMGCGSEGNTSKYVTNSVKLQGLVIKEKMFTLKDLKELNATTLNSISMVCGSGEVKDANVSYKGVKLTDLLDIAKVKISKKHDQNKIYIVANASDDYKVIFSYQELYNTKNGEGVIVFYEKNGVPLDDSDGKIALISADDIKTGPRHIKWLKSIKVVKIGD